MMELSNPSAVLASLRGQNITLCDLNALIATWPRKINPDLVTLRHDVDVWLLKYDAFRTM